MYSQRYRGYSLRNKIFFGFLLICLLSIISSSVLSYIILKNNATTQSKTDQQNKTEALMTSLDYAISHADTQTADIKRILGNEIYEIADISKHDVVIYDLKGDYLVSNRDQNLVSQKQVPAEIIQQLLKSNTRYDVQSYDENLGANVVSSYMLLRNNMLEPIGVVYFPFYHSDSSYMDVFNKYTKYILLVNIFIIFFSIWLSWIISKNMVKTITAFSDMIAKITLFKKDLKPIRYYKNDELNSLVKSYNRMILQIQEQRERLSLIERESAWREMAKQVAHEVKNPLTPMKLTMQNFERKFDPNDPDIGEKVKKLSHTITEQIDLIATVATAFSQFAQLPEKENTVFNLNREVEDILRIFSDDKVFLHTNKDNIMMNMDKIYLNRIITNLVTNALQAADENRIPIINVDLELVNKRVIITVQDNGQGIPENMYERIFEPSFTSKNSGMGLGLTMVKKMVEDYKGEIKVQSLVGVGSRFTISLPTNV